jgi:hypothetical protein
MTSYGKLCVTFREMSGRIERRKTQIIVLFPLKAHFVWIHKFTCNLRWRLIISILKLLGQSSEPSRALGIGTRSSLLSPAHSGSSLADFSTLKMGAIFSSETSIHTRSTRRHIPEDDILPTKHVLKEKCHLIWPVIFWENRVKAGFSICKIYSETWVKLAFKLPKLKANQNH